MLQVQLSLWVLFIFSTGPLRLRRLGQTSFHFDGSNFLLLTHLSALSLYPHLHGDPFNFPNLFVDSGNQKTPHFLQARG